MRVYTKDGAVLMPDTEIKPMTHHRLEPLRGYGYLLGVFEGSNCIGWTTAEAIGFPSVKAWLMCKEGR